MSTIISGDTTLNIIWI